MCKGNSDPYGTQSEGYGCAWATLILMKLSRILMFRVNTDPYEMPSEGYRYVRATLILMECSQRGIDM